MKTIPHPRYLLLLAIFSSMIAGVSCSSDEESENAPGGDGDAGTGGLDGGPGSGGESPGTGGNGSGPTACNLPALAAPTAAPTELLTVLPWAGKSAAVSYTFDDASSSQVQAYNTINALSVPFTFYVTTGWISDPAPWIQALADGHEIGNHSQTHPMAATEDQLDVATTYIEQNIGVTPLTMAAPYGDSSYMSLAMPRFLLNRGVGGGSIAPLSSANLYNLPTFTPPEGADQAALDAGVSSAISQGNWQTLLIHGFADFPDSSYLPISLDGFLAHVQQLRDSGNVWMDTMLAVGSYFIGQKLISEATPSVDGADSTFSWTLPQHFPAGRCVRVVSTGAVLQDGSEVPQDPNGYYDVALDVGQLTVRQ